MNNSIYNLKLHETTHIKDFNICVIRVPGGWLYKFWDFTSDDYCKETTFVPFDNEFQTKECQYRWKENNLTIVCGAKLPCNKHTNFNKENK